MKHCWLSDRTDIRHVGTCITYLQSFSSATSGGKTRRTGQPEFTCGHSKM